MKKIAVLASGSGSNAQNLVQYFHFDHPEKEIAISLIISNRSDAYVLERARKLNVPTYITDYHSFYNTPSTFLKVLSDYDIDFLVLAGFLWLAPPYLIKAYPGQIINIHPALLPAYGGKGMYGMFVHKAVIANGEKESGITIHLVDEEYDHGNILFQAHCRVDENETPDSLAQKIRLLEQGYFPKIVEAWVNGTFPQQPLQSLR